MFSPPTDDVFPILLAGVVALPDVADAGFGIGDEGALIRLATKVLTLDWDSSGIVDIRACWALATCCEDM